MPVLTPLENDWYSSQLSAAGEPSLWEASRHRAPGAGRTVRFTGLRSFHPPVVVRVDRLDSPRPRLSATELTGRGGYAPGEPGKRVDRLLSAEEAAHLARVVDHSRALAEAPKECSLGCDGAQWLVEAADAGGHHLVMRWSPERGPVREVGLAMLALTGWTFGPVY